MSITQVFQILKAKTEGALIGYVMCGDPQPDCTPAIADALIKGGIDILELGLPFSDPIADGPTIQAASTRALNAGTSPRIVLETAKKIKKTHNTPIVVMTYYNPVFKMGLREFFATACSRNVDGVIVPDLPVEEADEYRKAADGTGIATIFLAAPSTSEKRLPRIVECSSGFLYLVSHFGVTGTKASVEDSTISLIQRVRPFTTGKIPLAVGFGISKPEHAKRIIAVGADGVIVGSAFVKIINENQGDRPKMLLELEGIARKLKQATKQ